MLTRYFISLLLGGLTAFSMPGFDVLSCLFLGFGCFSLLLCLTFFSSYRPTKRQSFLLGWFYGFGYFLIGLYWIGNSLLVDGNSYAWAYPLAVMGLPFALAFFYGLATLLTYIFSLKLPRYAFFLLWPFVFFVFEYLREFVFTGFPWNYFAYAWHGHLEILQGLYLLKLQLFNFLSIFWGLAISLVVMLLLSRSRERLCYVLQIFLMVSSFSLIHYYGGKRLLDVVGTGEANYQFLLVQPNIKQSEKWNPELIEAHFDTLYDLSLPRDNLQYDENVPLFIVWPETALHYSFYRNERYEKRIRNLLSLYGKNAHLLTGALAVESQWVGGKKKQNIANSLIAFDRYAQEVFRYDKSHLVPFGEYIPFKDFIPLTPIAQFNNLRRGPGISSFNFDGRLNFVPLICYEVIFSSEVEKAVDLPKASIFVNITNDGWYGKSAGPFQHFTIARYRAIENGVPMLRVANTGITALIDRHGKIEGALDVFERDVSFVEIAF